MLEDLFLKYHQSTRDVEINCNNTLYLDHAGTPLAAKSLLTSIYDELLQTSFANPHSTGGKLSGNTEHIVNESRYLLLNHLHLSREEYEVIFTSGATASIKLVGEIFPWQNNTTYWYTQNVHTSLLGIRMLAESWRMIDSDLLSCINEKSSIDMTERFSNISAHESGEYDLLAIPGECNFSGSKIMFQSVLDVLKQLKCRGRNVMWLLDAAKLCGSTDTDLSLLPAEYRPHFIAASCYKIFGYPTGVGALIIRKDIMHFMKKKYFGGGTLLSGAADIDFAVPRPMTSHEYYEDGTLNFHGIAAIRHGFKFIQSLGGMQSIQEFTFTLWKYTITRMKELIHDPLTNNNLGPLCTIYSRHDLENINSSMQGPVITFNLQYANGEPVGFQYVNQLCLQHNIQIRTGCFCNLGGCQKALHFTGQENLENYKLGRICSDHNEIDVINHRNTGACRISFGFGSTKSDCDTFLTFLRTHFLNKVPTQILLNQLTAKVKMTKNPSLAQTQMDEKDHNIQHAQKANSSIEDLFWQQEVHSFPTAAARTIIEISEQKDILASQSMLPSTSDGSARIVAMFVYPIKSCAGVRVSNWPVTAQGLLFDRCFAIVTESGKVINQKNYPQLALIHCSFELAPHPWKLGRIQLSLHVQSEYAESTLIIPLEEYYDHNCVKEEEMSSVTTGSHHHTETDTATALYQVCGRPLYAEKVSHDADLWFTDFLHQTSQLLHTDKNKGISEDSTTQKKKKFSFIRASTIKEDKETIKSKCNSVLVDSSNGGRNEGKSQKEKDRDAVSRTFVNTAQYLLLSIESIRALIQMIQQSNEENDGNSTAAMQVKAENFRPNIIVSGDQNHSLAPHGEDQWKELFIPLHMSSLPNLDSTWHQKFNISGPCSRCSMVNVNGQRGIMDCRVFEALSEYRKYGSNVYFGQFVTLESGTSDCLKVENNNAIIGMMQIGSVIQYCI